MIELAYKRVLLIFIITVSFSLLSLNSRGQNKALDTISESFHHKPKFFVDLDSYNSIVNSQSALFTDLLLGLSYNRRLYFSAGISTLNTEVISSQAINNQVINNVLGYYTTNAQLNMFLFISQAEYVFSRDYPWTFSVIPFKLGVGDAYYNYISEPDKQLMRINEKAIVTYQPELTVSYNLLKWIGFGGSVGYRFTLFSSYRIHKDLNSFTYSYGIRLFFDPIYNYFFPHGIFPNGIFGKKKEKEPVAK